MKIGKLQVDVNNIATSIYAMICERDETEIVAFGMIPLWAVTALEKGLREKIISIAAEQNKCEPGDLTPYIDDTLVKEISQPVIREVVIGIFAAARKNGKLCV